MAGWVARLEHMNDTGVIDPIAMIATGLDQLAELIDDPFTAHFESIHPLFERLEQAFTKKAALDLAFAFAAELNEAGRRVGSSRTADYLADALDISRKEANARLKRAKALYDPPVEPPPAPEPEPEPEPSAADDAQSEEDLAREKEEAEQKQREQAEREERARRERKAQEQARKREASEEKRRIIDEEINHLLPQADPGPQELTDRALEYSQDHDADNLREWLKEQVREANSNVPGPLRNNAAFDKRYISLSKPDADGGVRIYGYLPGDMAAQLSEALNPTRTKSLEALDGSPLETTEGMSMGQKRAHLLVGMARDFLNNKQLNLRGVGSIVVSMTLDQLENMVPGDRFPTNTGHLVDPFALVRLGEAKSDFFVVHANDGTPLHADTGKRTANLYQRLALFATQLVCSVNGCDRPMSECEAHHLLAVANGGKTEMDNLAWLCWGHHRDNNDDRTPNGRGWVDRDPETGRVGYRRRAGEPLVFNDHPAAQRSGAAKIRKKAQEEGLFDIPV